MGRYSSKPERRQDQSWNSRRRGTYRSEESRTKRGGTFWRNAVAVAFLLGAAALGVDEAHDWILTSELMNQEKMMLQIALDDGAWQPWGNLETEPQGDAERLDAAARLIEGASDVLDALRQAVQSPSLAAEEAVRLVGGEATARVIQLDKAAVVGVLGEFVVGGQKYRLLLTPKE